MRSTVLAIVAMALLTTSGARAQAPISYGEVYDRESTYLAINAALGALSAGLGAWVGGRPVLKAMGWGVAGGAISYAGIRTVSRNGTGSPIPGLLLTAAGGSITRNAADGRGALSRWILPVGPLYIGLDLDDGVTPWVRVSVRRLRMTTCLALSGRYRFDAGESVRRLAPTFRGDGPSEKLPGELCTYRGTRTARAYVIHGSIVYSRTLADDPDALAYVLTHESTHIAQGTRDDLVLGWGPGVAIAERLGLDRWLIVDEVTPLRWTSLVLTRTGPKSARWQNSYYEREVRGSQGRPLCGVPGIDCHW